MFCLSRSFSLGCSSNFTRPFSKLADVAESAPSQLLARSKHKVPQKRASSLMNMLKQEELAKLINGRSYPNIRPGDAVAVEELPYATSKSTDIIKGVVIAKTNRGIDTMIHLLNVEYGSTILRKLRIYHPLVKKITILEERYGYKHRKTLRRKSKLYYLSEMNPKFFTLGV